MRTTFRRSPGTLTGWDVLLALFGRTAAGRHPSGTPALTCLADGVSVSCFHRSGRRWRRQVLDLQVGAVPRAGLISLRGTRVLHWGSRISVEDDDESTRPPDHRLRVVVLAVDDLRMRLALPRRDFPLLTIALRAQGATFAQPTTGG